MHTFIKQSLETNLLGILFSNIPALSLMVPAAAGGLAYFATHPNFQTEQAMKKRREVFQMAAEDLGIDEMEQENKGKKDNTQLDDGKYKFTG